MCSRHHFLFLVKLINKKIIYLNTVGDIFLDSNAKSYEITPVFMCTCTTLGNPSFVYRDTVT